jgi:hypothetical protein
MHFCASITRRNPTNYTFPVRVFIAEREDVNLIQIGPHLTERQSPFVITSLKVSLMSLKQSRPEFIGSLHIAFVGHRENYAESQRRLRCH